MRIIFLDFDGVIITLRSHYAFNNRFFSRKEPIKPWQDLDMVACNLIRRVCKYHNIKIVVSSTWRVNQKACYDRLIEGGLLPYLHEDWRTVQSDEKRGHQIQKWLDCHPEISSYRILDDDSDMLDSQMPFFIKCHCADGLNSDGIKKLMKWAFDIS